MKTLLTLIALAALGCSVSAEAPPANDKDLDTIVDELDNCPSSPTRRRPTRTGWSG